MSRRKPDAARRAIPISVTRSDPDGATGSAPELVALWAHHFRRPLADAAQRFGLTRQEVHRAWQRLFPGEAIRVSPDDYRSRVLEMAAQGATRRGIADALGIGHRTVVRIEHAAGVRRPRGMVRNGAVRP